MDPGDARLDDDDIAGLRRAAAMAHALGGLTIRLRSHGRVLATVAPGDGPPHRHHPAAGPVLDACGFRRAVARAWADHRAGQRVAVADQHVGSLDIEWEVTPPGRLLGFGGVRRQCGGRMVWALPSLLAPGDLTRVLDDVDDAAADGGILAPSLLESVEARLVRDDLLGVSVVHVEADRSSPPLPTGPASRLVGLLDEAVARLVAASAVAELLEVVTPVP